MENMTTKDFCRKFKACREGTKFALQYADMKSCYAALLKDEAGDFSLDWALWCVMVAELLPDVQLRTFAINCARRVEALADAPASAKALYTADTYVNGERSDSALETAWRDASSAYMADTGRMYSRGVAATKWWANAALAITCYHASITSAVIAHHCSLEAAGNLRSEYNAQLKLLAELGNPFVEAC